MTVQRAEPGWLGNGEEVSVAGPSERQQSSWWWGVQERRVPEGTHPWQMRPKRFLANENMAVLWEEVGSG